MRDRTTHTHINDPVTSKPSWETRVRLVRDGCDGYRPGRPMAGVHKIAAGLQLDAFQAEGFATLLDELADGCAPYQLRAPADEVRAASSVIDPARQGPAPGGQGLRARGLCGRSVPRKVRSGGCSGRRS
jgi:hypothetical protein